MAQVEYIIGQTNSNTRRIWVRGRGREGKGREEGREREGRGGRDRVELGDILLLLLCYDINALSSRGNKKGIPGYHITIIITISSHVMTVHNIRKPRACKDVYSMHNGNYQYA